MAYNVRKISEYNPDEKPLYFCDANVWIAVLKSSGSKTIEGHEHPYIDFFESVVNLHNITDPKQVKKIKNKPKFVLTSMLTSEIINAYMRNVAMKLFFGGGNNYKSHDFKREYRDFAHSDYVKEIKKLTSDIDAFKDYITLMDDNFVQLSPFNIFPRLKANTDFNDLYYHELLAGKDIPIITHDSDFAFENIEIITAHPSLLRLR